jgi:hypothetical protein
LRWLSEVLHHQYSVVYQQFLANVGALPGSCPARALVCPAQRRDSLECSKSETDNMASRVAETVCLYHYKTS